MYFKDLIFVNQQLSNKVRIAVHKGIDTDPTTTTNNNNFYVICIAPF